MKLGLDEEVFLWNLGSIEWRRGAARGARCGGDGGEGSRHELGLTQFCTRLKDGSPAIYRVHSSVVIASASHSLYITESSR